MKGEVYDAWYGVWLKLSVVGACGASRWLTGGRYRRFESRSGDGSVQKLGSQ